MLNTVTVYFEYDRAEYTLNMPWALYNNTLADARKLITFMCKSNDMEHEAAKKTNYILFALVKDKEQELKQAVKEYVDGYILPEHASEYNLSPDYVRKCNKRLKVAADKAKRQHEKACKLQTEFLKICDKNNIFLSYEG